MKLLFILTQHRSHIFSVEHGFAVHLLARGGGHDVKLGNAGPWNQLNPPRPGARAPDHGRELELAIQGAIVLRGVLYTAGMDDGQHIATHHGQGLYGCGLHL